MRFQTLDQIGIRTYLRQSLDIRCHVRKTAIHWQIILQIFEMKLTKFVNPSKNYKRYAPKNRGTLSRLKKGGKEKIIMELQYKFFESDKLPSKLLIIHLGQWLPLITGLVILSLHQGFELVLTNYRPVSSLQFLFKSI